jgi:hypothetical protein
MLKHSFPVATLTLALMVAPLPACSSGNDSSGGGSDLSGTYNTDVTLVSSTCAFPVQDNPTKVRATGGSITLTHAGNSYSGILNADSSFATQDKVVGGIYHISIAGDFTAAGINAQVTVNWSNTPCNAVVHWVGPKT